ncbi:DUF2341 domain-containing protein [Patescibacteria group bacterium]|nr:DUF2341 domain-containing protein [Patescibacteria group bacterium]
MIRPFKLLKKSTFGALLTITVISGFVVYGAYIDRTVYTTEQLVIIPGKVTSDSWLGLESVLVQDISEYSLYQDFTQKNSAYISELGLFSAQESEDAPTPDEPNEVSIDGDSASSSDEVPSTDSESGGSENGDNESSETDAPTAETSQPEPESEPEPQPEPSSESESVSSITNPGDPVWGVFTKTNNRFLLAQAIVTEEASEPEPASSPEPEPAVVTTEESGTEETAVVDNVPVAEETLETAVTEESVETTPEGSGATNEGEEAEIPVSESIEGQSEAEPATEEDTSNDYVMAPCDPASGCATHSMLFSDFLMPDFDGGTVLDSIQLRLSLAAQTKQNRGEGPQRFLVEYTYDTSTTSTDWITASVLDIDDEISNSINGGYYLLSLQPPKTAGEIANLQIKVSYQGNVSDLETAYVEGMWLEVTSGKFFEEGAGEAYSDEVTYGRDLLAPELNTLNNADLDPTLGTLPQFTLSYDPQQGFFNRIFRTLFSENTFVVERINLTDSNGDAIEVPFGIEYHDNETWTMKAQQMPHKLRPGKYLVTVDILENEERYTDTFEFYWGVLAVNTKKSMYFPNEEVQLNLAALTDKGDTICNANLELKIIDPKGTITEVPVNQSGACGPNNVTDIPDYIAEFSNTGEWGAYTIQLQHKNASGEVVHKISDSFEVRDYIPYDIERTAPTRIYPPAPYDVTLKVKAYRDFTGDVTERVPRGFVIEGLEGALVSTLPEYTLITWPDVTMMEGDERTFSYNFDAPDISPYMYLLGPLDMDGFSELRQWQVASDALNNIGWFTGTRTVASSSLNTAPSPMQWSTSSIDNYYYTHSTSSDSQRVTLRQSGDYLVSVNLPQQRADINVSRTRAAIEVRKNGVAVPEGLGRSGYITGGNGAVHSESSSNVSFLMTGVTANDYIEIFVENLTTIDAGDVINVSGLASMYIEYLRPTETVFAATTTRTTNSTNFNQVTAFPLEWIETRQDAGFSHSNTITPQNITLTATGTYMVHVNLPLQHTNAQQNIAGRILLDGAVVSGGHFGQGFSDGNANESDGDSSIHFSGVIIATSTNQVLTVTAAREGNTGTTTVPAGFTGSIVIQKLPTSGVIALRGRDLVGGTNWNSAVASSTRFNTQLAYDNSVFTHSTTTNNHQITVNQSGDYILNFTDAVTSATQFVNNRITVSVGSTTVTGAQSKSNFLRNLNAANEASTNLVFLLENVTAGQIITVNSQQEGAAGTISTTTDATLLLWKKADLNFRAIAPTMFATPFDNARFASTTPWFDFQSNDPDGSSDIEYEFSISTSSDFATATIRVSGTDAGFSNTASTSDTSPFVEANRVRFQLQPADTLTDLTTYYWRVRARDVSGSGEFGDYSTTQSFSINTGDTVPNWYQTLSGQFQTNSLFGAISNDLENNVRVNSTVSSEIMVAYGDSTSATPKYRLWGGTSWGIEQSAISVSGTINWVRLASGVKRDEYMLVTLDQSNDTFAQVYNATSSTWGSRTLLADNVADVTRRGIAVGYESVSGDAMVVSCDNTKNPVYRIWNGSTWSATTSITTVVTGVCNFLELASDPASDEMILVVRDSGAAIGNNYEALVWDGNAWGNSRVFGSVQAGQLLRAGIGLKYESSGDQAMVAVTNGGNNNFIYTTWTGTGWTSNATQPLFNDFEFGTLVSDPNSDKLTLCYINDSARVGAVRWDGGVWSTFVDLSNTGNSQAGRPIDCEFETTAGRSGNILATYSDTTNLRYQVYATSSWGGQQTVTGVGSGAGLFWVQTERAGDGTIVALSHDDAVAGDELESSYWNGTSWSTKQVIAPNPSSIIGAPYETFEMAAKRYQFTQGIVTTQPITFTSVSGQPTWGDLTFSSTEPFGTDVTVRLKYTSTTTCDTYIPNGVLAGNGTGFDTASLPVNLTALSTTTYSQICLEATLTTFGSASASLDDWSLSWVRKPKLTQNAFRWYGNGSFLTPTDPWPLGVLDVLENTALTANESVNLNDVIRLRMSLQSANVALPTSTAAFKLQYAAGLSCNLLSGWQDVASTSSSTAAWRGFANSIVGSDWLSASWVRRTKITVDRTLVSAPVTDFPVYVNLANLPTSFFNNVKADGGDIRITGSDGLTELPFELVSINTTTRVGELHFKANLATTTNSEFYIYYGNPSASGYAVTAPFGRNNVWTNGYEAVYHLDSNPASNMIDSTANGRTLTTNGGMTATNSTSSVMGNGVNFDGVNDRLTNAGWSWTATPVTVTAWNNVATAEVQSSNLFGFTAVGNERLATHAPWSDNTIYWDYGTCCAAPGRLLTNYTAYRNKWTHIGLVSQGTPGSFMGIYLDGTAIATSSTSDDPNVTLTGFSLGSDNPSGGNHHRGRIDEYRIASVARTGGWIATERNNQSNPTGFYALSAEELIGDGRTIPSTVLASSTFPETYEEQNPTQNNRFGLQVGQNAEWDFVLQNNAATADTNYCFRMVNADGSVLNSYANYPRLITNAPPLAPVLTAPFDNRMLASTSPSFEFAAVDQADDVVSYEIMVDNDVDFTSPTFTRESNANFSLFTNLAAPSERGQYTSGQTIQFIPNVALSNGVTYWWRVRAKDDTGSGAFGNWSEPKSFTINTATVLTTWHQTTGDQFSTNSLTDAITSTSTNDVGINIGFTVATTTSTAVDYDEREIGNAWGSVTFTQNVTSGSIRHFVEYEVTTNAFELVPDSVLPGNSAGFTTSPINLASLDTTVYNVLRVTSVLSGSPTLPRLQDMTIVWSQKIEPPTLVSLFDNAKSNSTLPALTFTTADPQLDDLQYEVQLSTAYNFAASSTFLSGVDAGFSNVTTPADTSPYNSGNTIRYQTQTALTNNLTYWWRARARDPGGSNSWSNYSEPKSFTIDTGVNTSVWFQTIGEQFATNENVNIETNAGGAQVATVVNGVMAAYGEGTGQAPQYRLWNGTAWSTPASADTVGAQIRWTRLKAAPTRPEYALATQGTDLDVNIQIYDSVTESWSNMFKIHDNATNVVYRTYDIGYETVSGRLMAIACVGNNAVYSLWDGGSWSATTSIALANGSACQWVTMASDPVSNEIIAVFRHNNGTTPDYEALVWNGSSWGNSNRFGDVNTVGNEAMALQYEESGNQAVLVVPNGGVANQLWKSWNGSTWSATGTLALGINMTWGSIKRDVGSDRMMLCYTDAEGTLGDLGVVPWTGSAWGTFTEMTQSGGANNGGLGQPIDCEFQTTQGTDGDVVIAYSDNIGGRYQTYETATGTYSGEFSLDVINRSWRVQTVRAGDGTVHALMFDIGSAPDRFDTSRWNGTAWTARENFSTNPSITTQPFDGALTLAAQTFPNFTEGTIRSTPITFTDGNSPRWERVRWNDTTPGASDVRYRVYYQTTPGVFALVPDSALSGNAAGFTNSPVSISGLDKNVYSVLKLDAELICSSGVCPSIQDWSVEWSEGLTISGSILEYDQLTAVASGTIAVAVNGVLQVGKTAQVSAGTSTQQVVFSTAGSSTFTVPAGVTNVTVKAWGAGGGSGAGAATGGGGAGAGAGGGFVQANLTTIPAENLSIFVGGGGAGGSTATSAGAGGGGGYSGVLRTATPLVVAAGGGGGGGGIGKITFVGQGGACAVSGAGCTPTVPAGTAINDVYIAVVHSRTDTAHTCVTNCTGWTEFSTQAGSAGEGRLSTWHFRRTGAVPPNPTFTGPATESYTARIWAFRGVATTGNPWDVVGANTAITPATTTFAGSNLSSTVPDAIVVHVGGSMDDNAWGPGTGACTNPTSAVDGNFFTQNTNGTDNSIFLCYRNNPQSSAGNLGVPIMTQSVNGPDVGRYVTFALRPQSSAVITASGGVGGGLTGGTATTSGSSNGGGGGTQSAGGAIGGGNATIGSAYTGGNGASGVGGGAGGAGGVNGGGAGGAGTSTTLSLPGGGGGGAGYFGGGGGASAVDIYSPGAGGGGGSSYIAPTGVTASSTVSGSSTSAGNNADPDYAAGVGAGAPAVATTSSGTAGGDGRVVVTWTTSATAGTWSIPNVAAFAGDTVAVFVQNASGTDEAVGVTTYDGAGDISGMQLSKRHLTIGSNDAPTVTNSQLALYANGANEDIFYSAGGGSTISLCAESTCGDARLRILAGATYAPGANTTAINFQNNGTFAPATSTFRISNTWQDLGVFTPGLSTVIFTATTSNLTPTNATSSFVFNNVIFGESSGGATWNLTKPLVTLGNLSIDHGTLARGTSTFNIAGNLSLTTNGFVTGLSTTTFDGTGSSVWGDAKSTASSTNIGNVVIDGVTKTITLSNNVGAESVTIGSDDTLNSSGSGFNINVVRNWTNNNVFIPQLGTVTFIGTTTGTIARGTSAFNNLSFTGIGGNWSFSTSTLALNGTLTIATGTVTLPTGTTTIGGNFNNSGGTFLHNNGEVRMTSASAGRTITQRATAFLNAFYDLVFAGSGSWSYTESAATTTRNYMIQSGTVTLPSGTLTVGGDYSVSGSGAFAHNSGEVVLLVQDSNIVRANGSSFNNIRTRGAAATSWYNPAWSARQPIVINSSQVPTTVTDFPVYVNLANLSDAFFSAVQASGTDIRVTTSDGITEVPHEVVAINTGAKTGELHFRAPSVSSTTNTTFFIYYGNSGASAYASSSPFGRNNVWTNGYEAVYHLGSSPAGTMIDSTSNGRNLTQSGGMGVGNSVAGVLGNGVDFDGINDMLLNGTFSWTSTPVTITAWNNVATSEVQVSSMFGFVAGAGDDRLSVHAPFSDNTLYWDYGNCCGATGRITTSYTAYRDKWTHVGLVSAGGAGAFMGIYLDGVQVSTGGSSDDPAVLTGFAIGAAGSSGGGGFHNGRVDEFRIASVQRAAGWIATEENNQASTTAFYSVSAPQNRTVRTFTDTNATILGNYILDIGGDSTFPTGVLSIGGSFDNNAMFTNSSGTVRFNSTAGSETIAMGTSSNFATLEFNSASGNFTVIENATATVAINLTSASAFTLQSGLTLATLGSFSNAATASSTTWTGSTLSLNGSDGAINLKSHGGDAYATILTNGDTDITMWNSTATTYSTASTSSIYSADHAGVDGDLNIYGDYVRTTGTEFWSFATDFDGAALTGSTSRQVDVRIASSSRVGFVGSSLNLVGTAGASTTIDAIAGTYDLSATTSTLTASNFTVAGTNVSGLRLNASTTLSTFQDGFFTVVPGRSGITISSTTVAHNPSAQYQRISFATTTVGAGTNVTLTGTTSAFVWFRNGTGNLYGEAFDAGDANPGSVRFDDSSNSIVVSGVVYADDGVTPLGAPTCNGSTLNVRIVVNNGSYSSSTSCAAGTGAFSFPAVNFVGDPTMIVYLDTNTATGTKGSVVTKTPTGNITNMHIYANRVITRHQDVAPLTIANMVNFQNSNDSDIQFIATTTGSTSLQVLAPNSLFVFATTTFAPGGNVTLLGNASSSAVEGTLQLGAAATFTASGTETHTLAGRLVLATTSTLTAASSTFVFNASTTGKSITSPNTVTFNTLQFTGIGGGWNITAPIIVAGNMDVATGTVTGTNNVTVQNGSLSGNGTVSFGSGTTTIERTNTFGGARAWTFANLVLGNGSVVGTTTRSGTATTTVSGRLTISSAHFLVTGNSNWDLSGTGSVFVENGTLLEDTSTFRYSGASSQVLSTTYYNLDINAGAGTPTYTAIGTGIGVTNNLTIGGTAASVFDVNTNDPALVIGGSVSIRSNGTFSASNIASTSISGSYTNLGTFTSNNGTVSMVGSGSNTIAAGNSSFATLLINNGAGTFTVNQNATTTIALTLLNHANFTVASGTTLAIGGTFTNTLGGGATTFSSSTLSFFGGGTKNINAKSVGDVYHTMVVASGTNVKMWNSSAVNYNATGGLYSQDHASVDGNLNIYGAYTQNAGNDFWSFATDFDGVALGGSPRKVDVRMASGTNVLYSGGGLEVIGTSTASTSILNQGAGTYGITATGTASTTWDSVVIRNINASGIVFSGTPAVGGFSRTDHLIAINGGTGMTVSGSVLNANPARNFTNNIFATSSGVTGTNVTAIGSAVSSWRFTNHTGNISGENFDSDPTGDPGYLVWDDSAALITVSGRVFSDEGVTVSPVCNGVTQNIVLRVAGLTTYTASCNAGTGAYSISNVAFSPADTLTVYIDNNLRKAVTISADPLSSISDMDLYENRVIVRHENTSPLSIADMAVWDSSDDGDIMFTAVDAGTDTLTLPADQKLLIWTGKTFEPNGNVTVSGGGGGGAQDGTLEAQGNATFRAIGTETHSIAGSMIFGTGATFTSGQSTTTFTTGGSGRTVDVNAQPFHNVAFTGSGSWNVTDATFTANRSLTQTNGTITFGTGTTTIGASFNATGGSFLMGGSALVFTSTTTGNTVRFDDSIVPSVRFAGTGGVWTMADTNATTTGSFTVASGTVTLPSGNLAVASSFENFGGTVINNTADIIMSATSSANLRAGGSTLFAVRFVGAGPFTMTDASLTLADSLTMSTGTLTLATGTLSVGGDFLIASGTVSNATGTVLFNATTAGKNVNFGNNALYNVVFGSGTGGWTFDGNATTTNNFSITGASNFTKSPNTTLNVGGVFTNTVGGSNTTWATTTLRLYGASGYTINTKTTGGDVYSTLEIASPLALRAWNSSAATTTVLGSASLYSQDHAAVDGALNIYGNFTIATTTEYWNFSNDFDGTVLAGAAQRQVNVRMASSATTTLQSGALQILGTIATSTTIASISGAYNFAVTGGTINAQYYSITNMSAAGLTFTGSPTITNLANGSYTLTTAGGSLITLDASALDANASKVFAGVGFATSSAITGFNVTLNGSTSNAWRFSGSFGNLSGEAFDIDGLTACGSIRFDNSGCLLTQQTHYRWRNDDGGEGVPNSEWFDAGFDYRQRVRVVNTDASSYASTAVKLTVAYDSNMQSDFDDLRFTAGDGLTTVPFWIERVVASTEAIVWVRMPLLPANDIGTVFMYYGSSTVGSQSNGPSTFDAFDDFEDNNITEYSGDTGLFQTDTAPVYGGTYALEAFNKSARTTDGIFRTSMTVSQGQIIRWMQYLDTTAGSGDEACTLFGVQSPGTNNNNYAVCLEQFGIDRIAISRNVSDNDVSGTVLASTTATFTTGWYEVEVDWRTNNSINAVVRTAAGALVATASTTDATYTSGGIGFSFWFQNGAWDSYTARPRALRSPAVFFGSEQTDGGATWERAQNVAGSGVTGANKRLRFAIENSGLNITNQTFRLEYAQKGVAPSCEAVGNANYTAVPNQASCGSSPVCMQTSSNLVDNDPTTDLLASTSGAFAAGKVIESPSNATVSYNLNQNTYTELEYVLTPTINATSSYCLRVTNGGTPLDFYNKVAEMNLQFDPVFGPVSLNGGSPILLTPGTTTRIFATGTVTDLNGYTDLVAGSSTIYRSGVGPLCSSNTNNCYKGETSASSSCSFVNCSGNTCTLSCTADIFFNAEATDNVPFTGEEWLAYLEVRDAGGAYDFESAIGVELITLRAAAVNNAINYGSLSVADNTGTFNPTTTVSNVGNVSFNIELLGTDLTDGGSSRIPAEEQRFATSTFNYSACVSCGVISSTTPALLALGLAKPTVPNPPVTAAVYWGIAVPAGVNSAPHSGINVFTPVSP